ncbi:unnamed protein product [Rangifer tarandus platyrhynchus]|uniref:Uncharacterized protein n=3 Tax=Rangifer tarandus platyrhynchus TaxID=3082113 RepID=A0AC59ZPN2_RANTA|nr:unnamed protein product [Rangifer tarandus platyrhynchus]CAI9707644.1 unnamed protein product [Rangifer tarandus platyrhynchus]
MHPYKSEVEGETGRKAEVNAKAETEMMQTEMMQPGVLECLRLEACRGKTELPVRAFGGSLALPTPQPAHFQELGLRLLSRKLLFFKPPSQASHRGKTRFRCSPSPWRLPPRALSEEALPSVRHGHPQCQEARRHRQSSVCRESSWRGSERPAGTPGPAGPLTGRAALQPLRSGRQCPEQEALHSDRRK